MMLGRAVSVCLSQSQPPDKGEFLGKCPMFFRCSTDARQRTTAVSDSLFYSIWLQQVAKNVFIEMITSDICKEESVCSER